MEFCRRLFCSTVCREGGGKWGRRDSRRSRRYPQPAGGIELGDKLICVRDILRQHSINISFRGIFYYSSLFSSPSLNNKFLKNSLIFGFYHFISIIVWGHRKLLQSICCGCCEWCYPECVAHAEDIGSDACRFVDVHCRCALYWKFGFFLDFNVYSVGWCRKKWFINVITFR